MHHKTSIAHPHIAVIGGGISGMGAAYLASSNARVTLFEAEKRLGGHARTITAGRNGDQPVDTGFLVFNYTNYPQLAALFENLDVPVAKSNMSFAASIGGGWLEYGLQSFDALFAQRKNIADPRFLRMIRDILRFNREALPLTEAAPGLTIAQLLERLKTGTWFRDYYLLPFSGAIWSSPLDKIMDFPAHSMLQFFRNHALLSRTGQHQWYTVKGGSVQYVSRLQSALENRGVELRLGTPTQTVHRDERGVWIKSGGAEPERFDEVIFATHSDDTLRLISDPSAEESAALGAITYQPNEVVLHRDSNLMPKRRKTWASWVYTEETRSEADRIGLTYWINSLQPVPMDDPHFVTLNKTSSIREELIYDATVLRHPVYDLGALAAQQRIRHMNGANNTWFCGAWMGNGFHEDGLASASDVVLRLEQRRLASIAAE